MPSFYRKRHKVKAYPILSDDGDFGGRMLVRDGESKRVVDAATFAEDYAATTSEAIELMGEVAKHVPKPEPAAAPEPDEGGEPA